MRMTDYIKLAKAVKENLSRDPDIADIRTIIAINNFLIALCNILAADNPRFDKVKFMEACK